MARTKVWLRFSPCRSKTIRTARQAPLFEFAQRAEVVRDFLRQHRHDAVGEVDRIAAQLRFAIDLRARANVVGHVGDGDDHDPAAGIFRIAVGFGIAPRRRGRARRQDRS